MDAWFFEHITLYQGLLHKAHCHGLTSQLQNPQPRNINILNNAMQVIQSRGQYNFTFIELKLLMIKLFQTKTLN